MLIMRACWCGHEPQSHAVDHSGVLQFAVKDASVAERCGFDHPIEIGERSFGWRAPLDELPEAG